MKTSSDKPSDNASKQRRTQQDAAKYPNLSGLRYSPSPPASRSTSATPIPWQRGSNENTNDLLRQYLSKSTDLSVHSAEDLARIAASLDNRPRRTLGFMKLAEFFAHTA